MFSKDIKMAISVKSVCLMAFLLVLLSRSEVEKTFRDDDSFPNGSEASRRGTNHNSHKLQIRVERKASLLHNSFIHGNPNMSSCFRCTVGYPSFRIQTIISFIYSPHDLYLLPIKSGFSGSKTSRQTSPLQPTSFNFTIQHNIYWERVLLAETRKTAFANFPVCCQRDVLGWGDLKKRKLKKNVISFHPQKVLLSILEFVLYSTSAAILSAGNVQCLLELIITSNAGTSILPSLSVILVTLTPAIEAYTCQLFRELRMFSLHRDKLEIDYLVENLRKKGDLGFDCEDLFWTLQIEIPGIHLYVQEFQYHYQSSFPFATAAIIMNWVNQLNLLVDTVKDIQPAPVTNRSDHGLESFVNPSLVQTGFTFCKENCCSSLEFTRLQKCEQRLENIEFQFLYFITVGPLNEQEIKELQQLTVNTEHLQDNLCSVGTGLCCHLDMVRSFRKWLNERCETLLKKIEFFGIKTGENYETFGIYIRIPNGKPPVQKVVHPLMSITTLARTIENGFDMKDFYLTLNGRILNDHLSIKEEKIPPSSIIDVQLRMRGGGKQCCLAGCMNDAGSYPLTACRGSYEIKGESLQTEHVCLEHYSWDRDNHVNYGTGELAYIPCCSCQKNIKFFRPYGCSKHRSNFLNSTFHVTCNSGDNVFFTSDVLSTSRNKNFICISCSQGLKRFRAQQANTSSSSTLNEQPVLPIMASRHLDMGHLYSLLVTKLPSSWNIAISGDRTIQLLFSPVRNEKQYQRETNFAH